VDLLDQMFLDDEDGEEKARFIEILTQYVSGSGKSLHVQAYEQHKSDYKAMKNYEEEEGQDDPPQKIKGISALWYIERMMHQTEMLDATSSPTIDTGFDSYAKRYTIQDLVLVITMLSMSLVKNKALVMPSFAKPSKAKASLLAKREAENNEKKEKVSVHRKITSEKLIKKGVLEEHWEEIEERVIGDLSTFYGALNKRTKEDNGEMMSMFTGSRVDAFAKWDSVLVGKNKKRVREIAKVDEASKEVKRKKCEAILNGEIDMSEDEDWI